MVSLFFVNKRLTALVTGQKVPAGAQLQWLPDEVSKAESLLSSFEQHEESLLDSVRLRTDTSVKWHKYANSYDPPVRRLFEASDSVKSEIRRRRLFGCFDSNRDWPQMDSAGRVISHAPYVGICKFAASGRLRRFSGSSSTGIGPSASQIVSSVGDDASDVTGVSGLNSIGEDKSMMLKTCNGPMPIHQRWYEFPSGTCRSGDLSVAPSPGEEHDARYTVRLYKDTMREDAKEFGDPLASVRAPTQQELKIAKRVAAYAADDMDKVARID